MYWSHDSDEYRKHIERDSALERRFQPILVGEPTTEEVLVYSSGIKDRYEAITGLKLLMRPLRLRFAFPTDISDRFYRIKPSTWWMKLHQGSSSGFHSSSGYERTGGNHRQSQKEKKRQLKTGV